MGKAIRLFVEIFSISLRRTLTYRANLLFQIGIGVVGVAASLATLGVVFSKTASLAGWSLAESMVLLGTFDAVSGLLSTFVQPNLDWFEAKVRNGEIDEILLQPAPSIFLASLGSCNPLGLSGVALGVVVIVVGAGRLPTPPTLAQAVGYVLVLAAAVMIGWATRVFVASLAFWAQNVSLNMLYSTFWQLGRYPIDVYRQPAGFLLTYIIPVAFVATVPARILTQGTSPALLLGVAVATAGAILVARTTWNAGLRRYTSATS